MCVCVYVCMCVCLLCAVLCCVVLCCAVLCCVVLCCVVLYCVQSQPYPSPITSALNGFHSFPGFEYSDAPSTDLLQEISIEQLQALQHTVQRIACEAAVNHTSASSASSASASASAASASSSASASASTTSASSASAVGMCPEQWTAESTLAAAKAVSAFLQHSYPYVFGFALPNATLYYNQVPRAAWRKATSTSTSASASASASASTPSLTTTLFVRERFQDLVEVGILLWRVIYGVCFALLCFALHCIASCPLPSALHSRAVLTCNAVLCVLSGFVLLQNTS